MASEAAAAAMSERRLHFGCLQQSRGLLLPFFLVHGAKSVRLSLQ